MKITFINGFAVIAVVVAANMTPMDGYAQAPNIDAQTRDIGMREYVNNCAVCHGDWGKGDGPLAVLLKKPVPDLSAIQKNNSGVFPFDRIYGIVDGREEVAAHGLREMPVWGKSFSKKAEGYFLEFVGPKELESFVRGRIVALVGYIYSLQEK